MEFDSGDFDRRIPLPGDSVYCTDEVATHTYAGVGIDPSATYNLYGGEVQVAPQASEEALFDEITNILSTCLRGDVRFPGSIHMHIRVPYLLECPALIKKVVLYCTEWWPHLAPLVHEMVGTYEGAYNVWNAEANKDIKTLTYPPESLVRMMQAPDNPKAIAAALHNNDTVMKNEWVDAWITEDTVKRPAINFGHLAINETIEFRPFIITTTPEILRNIIAFPAAFLEMALTNDPNPYRLAKKKYQDKPFEMEYFDGVCEMTTGYFNNIQQGITMALVEKKITVEDLGCPEFFIRRGFQ